MSTAIFFNIPAHGHTNPTLPVVAELVKCGERIIYYSQEEFRAAIEQTGASFQDYGDFLPLKTEQPDENMIRLFYQLMHTAQVILPRLISEVQAIKPDYIIHDSLCLWGKYVAQITGIPAICSCTTFAITPRLTRSIPSNVLREVCMHVAARKEKARIYAIATQLSQKYTVLTPDKFDVLTNVESLNIVYTSKEFQPFAHLLNDSFRLVGASIYERPEAPSFPFEWLEEDKALIYISLGTAFNMQPEFYRHCCEAFANTNVQVVMAIGRRISAEQLGKIPDNILVRGTVPQLALLQRAALFITHAGMNSASEALYYGVPMIAVPLTGDQPWVARRIEQVGAGKVLQRWKVSASRLRRMAEVMIANPAYAQASARMGETLRQAGGYQRAADEVQAFKRAHHIKP
jgi:MGT family glycosyltransferase